MHFKMFQSLEFKQRMIIGLTANYNDMFGPEIKRDNYSIKSITVQCMTAAEPTLILFKNPRLLDSMYETLRHYFTKLQNNNQKKSYQHNIFRVLIDFEYLARSEHIQYFLANTDVLETLIDLTRKLYFCDTKPPRTTMIEYAQYGSPSIPLLNVELYVLRTLKVYLKHVKIDDLKLNSRVMAAFLKAFVKITDSYKEDKCGHAIFALPLHRAFSYYLSRLFVLNRFSDSSLQTVPLTLAFKRIWDRSRTGTASTEETGIPGDTLHIFSDTLGATTASSESSLAPSSKEQHELLSILQVQMQQLSFIHELYAKKWVYYGDHLPHYASTYFKVSEKLPLKDIGLVQLLLCLDGNPSADSSLINYMLLNFGLDGQLKSLVAGLLQRDLAELEALQIQHVDKLQSQLLLYLRFIAQLCITEKSYLGAAYFIDENSIDQPGHEKVRQAWATAMKREAVNSLMLQKLNVNIETLKQKLMDDVEEDKYFEQSLFEVSTQGRDLKNQVTFKLKEKCMELFDPFAYLRPEEHSEVFKQYQQNEMDKIKGQPGLNDIVGDFKSGQKYATDINYLIIKNLSQSVILDIILPLLEVWASRFELAPGEEKEIEKMTMGALAEQLVDQNVGYHCLKLLILVLSASSGPEQLNHEQQQNLAFRLGSSGMKLINLLTAMVAHNLCDEKLHGILSFTLNQIFALDKVKFKHCQTTLYQGQDVSMKTTASSNSDFKKKQAKLMSKLKKKGGQILKEKTEMKVQELEEAKEREGLQCAFCQDYLIEENFIQNPFGNMAYFQQSKVLYHSMGQTVSSQRQALANQAKTMDPNWEEAKGSIMEPSQGLSEPSAQGKVAELKLLNEVWFNDDPALRGCLDRLTGTGGVLSHCKHYAHQSCLSKHIAQQEHSLDHHTKQRLAFTRDEFRCPICKKISNVVFPGYPQSALVEVLQDEEGNKQLIYRLMLKKLLEVQQGCLRPQLVDPLTAFDYLVHQVQLTDVKGLSYFQDNLGSNRIIFDHIQYTSIGGLFQELLAGERPGQLQLESLILKDITILAVRSVLMAPLCVTLQTLKPTLRQVFAAFMPLIKLQCMYAVLWRKHNGVLPHLECLPQTVNEYNSWEEEVSKDQYLTGLLLEAELPSLRKLLAAVILVIMTFNNESIPIQLSEIIRQTNDACEHQLIQNALKPFTEKSDEPNPMIAHFLSSLVPPDCLHTHVEAMREHASGNPAMPISLVLLTPFFQFNSIALPSSYLELQTINCKQDCSYCKKDIQDKVICLFCGQVMCWIKIKDGQCSSFKEGEARQLGEGLISYHCRVDEGGIGLFMHSGSGNIICIQNGVSAIVEGPYRSKYGECFDPRKENWGEFVIDQQGGGQNVLAQLIRQVSDSNLANTILSQRTNLDSKLKVYVKNYL